MRILVTFEHPDIPIYSTDLLRLLKFRGHELVFYRIGSGKLQDPHNEIGQVATIVTEAPDYSSFDVWLYDATTWETQRSPFLEEMEKFCGFLININYEDGCQFFLSHLSDYVIEKTSVYINNTLWKDRERYDVRIRNKLMLSPSYIGNSQEFKSLHVPFNEKKKRAIFTGNITGFTESGDQEELKCRIKVPMALINAGFPCYYRIYSSDPAYKALLETVPDEYKLKNLSWKEFIDETINSMIILSLRGNGHTVRRYFEGLASGGLVFSTKSSHMVNFMGQGQAGEHFVEIDWSGKDVADLANYYVDNPDLAEKIAANGRKLWEETCMLDDNKQLPEKVSKEIVRNIYYIAEIKL